MPVQKVPNEWGDMKNLMPADFGTSDIPPVPVPPNFGLADPNDPKAYNWQQWLIDLKDVPKPIFPADVGKSLIFRPNIDASNESAYSVKWEIPERSITSDRWTTARDFSISGMVRTSSSIPVDGSQDVNFTVETTQPQNAKIYGVLDQTYVRTVPLEPQDGLVYARVNDTWVDITSALIPPNIPIESPGTFPPVDDISNNAFIEYRIATPLTINLTIANIPKLFTIYAQAEAVEFTGDVIALNDGSLVLPHGAVATVKKLSTGEYLVIGNTALP